jgi:hypothetical protein
MNVKIINLDSCYSNYLYDNNNLLTPYYCEFPFSLPIRNIKKISLMSFELPVLFNNIRANDNNYYSLNYLSFTYQYNTVNYTASFNIPEGFYNSVNALTTAINATIAADATLTARNIQVVFSSNNNKIVITSNSTLFRLNNKPNTNDIFKRTAYPFMNLILGFVSDESTTANINLTAPNRYNLNIDNYINFQIMNLPFNSQNLNNIPSSFKIPVNSVNGVIYYLFNNQSYEQFITNTDNNLVLDKLTIRITDRFNNYINANGADWSSTFKVEYNEN